MKRLTIMVCTSALLLCTANAQAAGGRQNAPRVSTTPGVTPPVVPPSAPAVPPLQPVNPAPQVAVPPAQGLIMPSSPAVVRTQPAQVPSEPAQSPSNPNMQNGAGQP